MGGAQNLYANVMVVSLGTQVPYSEATTAYAYTDKAGRVVSNPRNTTQMVGHRRTNMTLHRIDRR